VEYFEEKWKLVKNLKLRIKIFFIDVKGRQSVDMISTFPTTSVCDTLSLHPSVLTFQQSSLAGSAKTYSSAEVESLIIQMH
jgi:hypothetical protein